jgi:hypothetical protein
MNDTLTYSLSRWTTDELINEVIKRSAGSRRALNILHVTTLRALLNQSDRDLGRSLSHD